MFCHLVVVNKQAALCVALCVSLCVSLCACVCVWLALLLTRCWGDKAVITFVGWLSPPELLVGLRHNSNSNNNSCIMCRSSQRHRRSHTRKLPHTHTHIPHIRLVKAIKCLVFYLSIPFMLLLLLLLLSMSMTASEPMPHSHTHTRAHSNA